jgi:hypothetical protein
LKSESPLPLLSTRASHSLTSPPWSLFVFPYRIVTPENRIFKPGLPVVSVLLLSLRLSRNSQSMFLRFLTVPTYQHFLADICVSPTVASTPHPRKFRSQTLGNDYLSCIAPSILAASVGFSCPNNRTSAVETPVSSSDKHRMPSN